MAQSLGTDQYIGNGNFTIKMVQGLPLVLDDKVEFGGEHIQASAYKEKTLLVSAGALYITLDAVPANTPITESALFKPLVTSGLSLAEVNARIEEQLNKAVLDDSKEFANLLPLGVALPLAQQAQTTRTITQAAVLRVPDDIRQLDDKIVHIDLGVNVFDGSIIGNPPEVKSFKLTRPSGADVVNYAGVDLGVNELRKLSVGLGDTALLQPGEELGIAIVIDYTGPGTNASFQIRSAVAVAKGRIHDDVEAVATPIAQGVGAEKQQQIDLIKQSIVRLEQAQLSDADKDTLFQLGKKVAENTSENIEAIFRQGVSGVWTAPTKQFNFTPPPDSGGAGGESHIQFQVGIEFSKRNVVLRGLAVEDTQLGTAVGSDVIDGITYFFYNFRIRNDAAGVLGGTNVSAWQLDTKMIAEVLHDLRALTLRVSNVEAILTPNLQSALNRMSYIKEGTPTLQRSDLQVGTATITQETTTAVAAAGDTPAHKKTQTFKDHPNKIVGLQSTIQSGIENPNPRTFIELANGDVSTPLIRYNPANNHMQRASFRGGTAAVPAGTRTETEHIFGPPPHNLDETRDYLTFAPGAFTPVAVTATYLVPDGVPAGTELTFNIQVLENGNVLNNSVPQLLQLQIGGNAQTQASIDINEHDAGPVYTIQAIYDPVGNKYPGYNERVVLFRISFPAGTAFSPGEFRVEGTYPISVPTAAVPAVPPSHSWVNVFEIAGNGKVDILLAIFALANGNIGLILPEYAASRVAGYVGGLVDTGFSARTYGLTGSIAEGEVRGYTTEAEGETPYFEAVGYSGSFTGDQLYGVFAHVVARQLYLGFFVFADERNIVKFDGPVQATELLDKEGNKIDLGGGGTTPAPAPKLVIANGTYNTAGTIATITADDLAAYGQLVIFYGNSSSSRFVPTTIPTWLLRQTEFDQNLGIHDGGSTIRIRNESGEAILSLVSGSIIFKNTYLGAHP